MILEGNIIYILFHLSQSSRLAIISISTMLYMLFFVCFFFFLPLTQPNEPWIILYSSVQVSPVLRLLLVQEMTLFPILASYFNHTWLLTPNQLCNYLFTCLLSHHSASSSMTKSVQFYFQHLSLFLYTSICQMNTNSVPSFLDITLLGLGYSQVVNSLIAQYVNAKGPP